MTACHPVMMDQVHQLHLGLGGSGGGNAMDTITPTPSREIRSKALAI